MSIEERVKCNYCPSSEPMPLNHLWTVVVSAGRFVVLPGLHRQLPDLGNEALAGAQLTHACGPECVTRAASQWMGKVLGHETHVLKATVRNP